VYKSAIVVLERKSRMARSKSSTGRGVQCQPGRRFELERNDPAARVFPSRQEIAMFGFRSNESPQQRRPAFMLIELLVVVAVIGLLTGILLPVLGRARDRARDLRCLANHKQFATAWANYTSDNDTFPVIDSTNPYPNTWSWGGVDWYLDDADMPTSVLEERPMNPYLGAHKDHEAAARVFQCPRDNSMRYTTSDQRIVWEEEFGYQSTAEDRNESVFSILGTSYGANDWIWVDPQSREGYGSYPWPHYRPDMDPDDVLVSASRFVLVGDWGVFWAGRLSGEHRKVHDTAYGFWHGYEIGMMSYLDGSARREEMGATMTRTYSFWSNPPEQMWNGYRP
jgi:type II secretory pathway pseudopilin PulG